MIGVIDFVLDKLHVAGASGEAAASRPWRSSIVSPMRALNESYTPRKRRKRKFARLPVHRQRAFYRCVDNEGLFRRFRPNKVAAGN